MERIKNKHGEKNSISIPFWVCARCVDWIGLDCWASIFRMLLILDAMRVTSKYFISMKKTQRK